MKKRQPIIFLPTTAAELLLLCAMLLLPCAVSYAQDGNPRHPGVAHFEQLGKMNGSGITPLSDINADGIADFALMVSGQALVYHGVRGGLPESTSGVRVGPTEQSATRIRAIGDWDGMHGLDICAEIELANDTSFGNPGGYQVFRMVVFWNDGNGGFSLNDTTRLSPGVDASFGALLGTSADLDKDGVEDLVLQGGSGLSNGAIIRYPKLHIFKGHKGKRWGREGIAHTPDWQWWNAPNTPRLDAQDLDRDSAIDVILYSSDNSLSRPLSVLYGRHDGALPDTLADLQQVDMVKVGGWATNFADVTGDRISDLTVLNTSASKVFIYVGCKGQRLLDQFGTGNEPPQGERWWGKPWATVKGPKLVSDAWFDLGVQLFDLGSADSNATEEIWVQSSDFLICYDVGGRLLDGVQYGLDSIFDGQVYPWGSDAKRLGDIDGDSRAEFSVTSNGEVRIYRMADALPEPMGSFWRVPDGNNKPASVGGGEVHATSKLSLTVAPNPSSGEVRIRWQGDGGAKVRVTDMLGQEVTAFTVTAGNGETIWDASRMFGGRYFITVTVNNTSETIGVVLR